MIGLRRDRTNKDQRAATRQPQDSFDIPRITNNIAHARQNSTAMWQDSATYGAPSSSQNSYYGRGNQPNVPLQFYDQSSFYVGSRSSLEGNAAQGSIATPGTSGFAGSIQPAGGWWTAFGTGGFEGEPPLLEGESRSSHSSHRRFPHTHISTELGINFSHIRAKSMTVLNPFRRVDERIMDDADLAGPLIFCFCFATFLLFVRVVFLPACLRSVPHTRSPKMCAVRQATIRVYLWPRVVRLHQPLLSPKLNVRARYRRLPCALCARLLLATHGWRWRTQRRYHVGVRNHPC